MSIFRKRLQPRIGDAIRRHRAAAEAARAERQAYHERIESKIDNLGERIDGLRRAYVGPRIRDRVNLPYSEHRRLMVEQAGVPWRDRVFYALLDKRYWKWHQTFDGWRKRDFSNGEVFGPIYESVTFQADGFRAKQQRRPWKPAEPNSPSEPGRWTTYGGATTGRWTMTSAEYLAEVRKEYDPNDASFKTETTMLTPLHIALLCARASGIGNPLSTPEQSERAVVRKALYELINMGLLEEDFIRPTEKGLVFVAHLVKQPLPVPTVPKWEVPNGSI